MQRILNHLEQLVSIYPCTSDQTSVKKALEYCQAVLAKSGQFSNIELHTSSNFHSLTAATNGTKKPKLLLQAHIDVVPCSKTPVLTHDKISKTVTGRGVYDMLFATACYLAFIEANAEDLKTLDIGLMLTGDEEIGGFNGVEYLLDRGYGAEICFLPDAGEGFGDLSIAAKGIYNFDIRVYGKAHHGSRPWEGDGAANKLVYMMHELLDAFDESNHENSTMTITQMECGDCHNRGPDTANAHLDIRYKDLEDFQRIEKVVHKLCQKYDAEAHSVIVADSLNLDPGHSLIQDFLDIYEKHTSKPITLSKAHGGSDARFFAARDIPVILMRPDGSGAHGDDETLSVPSLERFYGLLEDYILRTAVTTP